MHIVIVGCGRVGSGLASSLSRAGHSVAVVDKRRMSFARLDQDFPGQTIEGYGFDRDTLVAAGIEGATALAAVTSGDNSNIVTARVAREHFGVGNVVARIYDPRRAAIFQRLGVSTVAAVGWTTDQIARRIAPDAVKSEWVDSTGAVATVEIPLPASLVGTAVRTLHEPGRWWLTTVTRLGRAQIARDDLLVQEGDVGHFVVNVADLEELSRHCSERRAS